MVIRLGFSNFFSSSPLMCGEKEGKMLESRWTSYKNSKTFCLLFENVFYHYEILVLHLNNCFVNENAESNTRGLS